MSLKAWGFEVVSAPKSDSEDKVDIPIHLPSPTPSFDNLEPGSTPSASPGGVKDIEPVDEDMGDDLDDLDDIDVEAEVCELVSHTQQEIQSWDVLRDQIKLDLKKKQNLPLSKINQLLILHNFATLHLKGY